MLKFEDFYSKYRSRLPVSFDNSMDLYESFTALVEYFNKVIDNNNSMVDFIYLTKEEQNIVISEIRKDLDDFLKNKEQQYINFMNKWLDENMENIISDAVKMVWFGLTDDGYFMAVIPKSWNEIEFDTSVDGELILQY